MRGIRGPLYDDKSVPPRRKRHCGTSELGMPPGHEGKQERTGAERKEKKSLIELNDLAPCSGEGHPPPKEGGQRDSSPFTGRGPLNARAPVCACHPDEPLGIDACGPRRFPNPLFMPKPNLRPVRHTWCTDYLSGS